MSTDYRKEQDFFDRVAEETVPTRMSSEVLERYAHPRWPQLFSKEMMFHLAGDLKGKHVLEVGCGEGVASVQLAYCGAVVDAIDISPVSIEVARARATLNDQSVNFVVGDVTKGSIGDNGAYDIVWCDLILHHLVDSLDFIMHTIHDRLRPGGLFLAREPVAYAHWLKSLRTRVPVALDATDDEQPLRQSEFDIIRQQFPDLETKYFRLLARADMLGANLATLRFLARVDNALLMLPGVSSLAGNVVIWGHKH